MMLFINQDAISILVVVILYKKRIIESETLEFLSKQKILDSENLKISLKIIDNSEGEYISQEDLFNNSYFDKYESVTLLNHYNNDNLGFIYNEVIIEDLDKFNYFNILDDDSILPPDFYINFQRHQIENDSLVYIPKIMESKEKLYSPKNQPPFIDIFNISQSYSFPVDSVGEVLDKEIFAVMSGLFLKSELFENGFSFCEDLKLYGLDNQLFLYLKKFSISTYILPIFIEHSPSYLAKDESIEKVRFRYTQRSLSRLKLATLFGFNPIRAVIGIFVSTLSMVFKHKHPSFIFDFFSILVKQLK